MTPWRALALLAFAGSVVAGIGPTSAFDWAQLERSAAADVVSTEMAYSALTIGPCHGSAVTESDCDGNSVLNLGTTAASYRIRLDSDPGNKIVDYGIAGGAVVTSGFTSWSAEQPIGTGAAFNLDVVACGATTGCSSQKTYHTYWTVEGQKADILDFTATQVRISIQYP